MGFKEVSSLDADVTIALGKTDKSTGKPYPKSAEGYFLGSRTVENKRGESKLHFLQTRDGNVGLWGTTDLNRKLSNVNPGVMIRVTSTGTKPTPNGDMYTYKVEVDADNTIEVVLTEQTPVYEAEASFNAEDSYTDGNNEQSEQSAALLAAERKAKVQAIINRGKTK
jgi:hypothetical protein